MMKIEPNTGALVAAESQNTLKIVDDAILNELRFGATLVEAIGASEVPVASSQKLLQTIANGLNHFVAARGEMASTIRHLTAIKDNSNLAPLSYGCPSGPLYTGKIETSAMRVEQPA